MRQLSGLDAAFLNLETATSSGHVGGVVILDPSTAREPLTLDRFTRLLEERLPLVPVMRQRLLHTPLGLDQPYWIDDPSFDGEYHIREVALPAPGAQAQLTEQVARLHARPLDRTRPLWEAYLITGLGDGLVAVYVKMHHAAIDGASGAELLTILLDLSPEGREVAPAAPFEPQLPRRREVLGVTARGLVDRPLAAVKIAGLAARALPVLAPAATSLITRALRLDRGDGRVIPTAPLVAPATPFNVPVTQHRRVAFRSVDLGVVREVKTAFGVSVNDVVLAMCAGALRRWLDRHDALPEDPLVAMVPVSLRDRSSGGALGNAVSVMLTPLPTDLDAPARRIEVAHQATTVAKSRHATIPQGLVDDITDFAPPALTARATRVVAATGLFRRLPPFNVVISNVPGPNVPVYLGGARMVANYPVSVVADAMGLNITLIGYLDQLHFGLVACRELVPDLDDLADLLADELEVLHAAALALA